MKYRSRVALKFSTMLIVFAVIAARSVTAMSAESGFVLQSQIHPLPDSPIQQFHIDRNGGRVIDGGTAGATGTLVYKNTLGANFFAPGTNLQIADDILTIASGGCDMTFLEVLVTGGGNGSGPGFDATATLLTGCPSSGGTPIPGAEVTMSLPNNGAWLVTLNLEGMEVDIPQNPWLGVSFSNETAGWIFGRQAEIGYSENIFHHPQFPCTSWFGPTPPNHYSAFYAEIWCGGNVETQFEAYRSNEFSGFLDVLTATDLWADDIVPITSPTQCEFVRYDSDIAGLMGNFSMKIELYTNDTTDTTPLAPIMGTAQTCNGAGGGALVTCTKTVFPGIMISTSEFWVGYDLLTGTEAGPILVSDFPAVGDSEDGFSIFGNPDAGQWSPPVWWYGGCDGGENPCGTFQNTIYCAGTPPVGACCDVFSGAPIHCTDIVVVTNCTAGRWLNGQTCETAAFNPPCGTSACCTPSNNCENLTNIECSVQAGLWQPGQFCGDMDQLCPPGVCLTATNPCGLENNSGGGCVDANCCATVCEVDSFCCSTAWDSNCVGIAAAACDLEFPTGSCCQPNDICETTTHAGCTSATWTENQPCSPNPCFEMGACCTLDGTCDETLSAECAGHSWTGGATCETQICPVLGSCCTLGNCSLSVLDFCIDGDWTLGQLCVPNSCPPVGACCEGSGSCSLTTASECSTRSWIAGTTCDPNICPQPGSCCEPTGVCTICFDAQCTAGTWTVAGQCLPNTCPQPPTVAAIGSRYISISADDGQPEPVAFRVSSVDHECVQAYVADSGLLTQIPSALTPEQWQTVYVGDTEIVPDSEYTILAVGPTDTVPVTVTTWSFGDTNNDWVVNLDDILCELAAFGGNYSSTCTLYSADQIGGFFNPDRVVNLDDILAVLNAFSGQPYSGSAPCP